MTKRAIILGGTGAIGGATAQRMACAGWNVDVTGRDPDSMPGELTKLGVTFHALDRTAGTEIGLLIRGGADLVVDTLAFSVRELRNLLPYLSDVTATTIISARAVYTDQHGRHLNSKVPPHFTHPIREDHTRVRPDPEIDPTTREGYAQARAMVEDEALSSGFPITLIRPSRVYGHWARNARTRYFVEKMAPTAKEARIAGLDRKADQLTAAANIAQLIEAVTAATGAATRSRALNCADPDTPTMRQLAEAIAEALDWPGVILPEELESTDSPAFPQVSSSINAEIRPQAPQANPFLPRIPVQLDLAKAVVHGYKPVGATLDLIGAEATWIASTLKSQFNS